MKKLLQALEFWEDPEEPEILTSKWKKPGTSIQPAPVVLVMIRALRHEADQLQDQLIGNLAASIAELQEKVLR